MSNENKLADTVASMGSSITSPAKLAFAGYVVLAYKGIISTETWQFFAVAIVFFLAQVLHDDYWRILFNKRAELKAEKERHKSISK